MNKNVEDSTATLLPGKSKALGVPGEEKRFWFQRSNNLYNPDAIATQPSVYDDPETAEQYRPEDDWENVHRFDPDERWTVGEEHQLIRKIDRRIMVFAAIMFMALELDRSNISQALTDNFLEDLGMATNGDFASTSSVNYAKHCKLQPWQHRLQVSFPLRRIAFSASS
jgi:hypothetical protein